MTVLNFPWVGSDFPPRDWQRKALSDAMPAIWAQINDPDAPKPVIRAIMGAGKSVLIAEICRQFPTLDNERIVVAAPTQKLVTGSARIKWASSTRTKKK